MSDFASLQHKHEKKTPASTSSSSVPQPARDFAPPEVASTSEVATSSNWQAEIAYAGRFGHSISHLAIHADEVMQRTSATGGASLQPQEHTQMINATEEQGETNQTGLPATLKAGVERLSGYSLSDIRVHYNSPKPAEVDALAYTQGTEIHVGPGQEQHLAHEAWHVVQQKQGLVQPTTQVEGAAINNDDGLEKQADMMGERATAHENISHTDAQASMSRQNATAHDTLKMAKQSGKVMQRLASLADFKELTKVDYSIRSFSSINAIDSEIEQYHSLGEEDFFQRERQLRRIEIACIDYLKNAQKNDKRLEGVEYILGQAKTERSYIAQLKIVSITSDPSNKLKSLFEAQDAYLEAKHKGHPIGNGKILGVNTLGVYITGQIDATVKSLREKKPKELESFIKDDLAKLAELQKDPTLPDVTKNVLAEVLSNVDKIHFEEGMSGATFSKEGVSEKYTVLHNLSQPEGTVERLGSLAHEMTHVSTSETFDNTPAFLAFPPNASEDKIKALVAKRTTDAKELADLLSKDNTMTDDQKLLVKSKIDYAKGDKIGLYAAKFSDANKASKNGIKYSEELIADLKKLATYANNAVIEYDTTMNQMLVYMAMWKMPMKNAFYTKLRAVAEEAFKYRENARQSAKANEMFSLMSAVF